LLAGMLSGLVVALIAFSFARVYSEPSIERAIAYQHHPNAVNFDIQKLQAVTTADVQRVMKKYFTDTNRSVVYYTQGEEK